MNLDPIIRATQRAVGADDDGRPGPDTWRRIFKKVTGKDWAESSDPATPYPTDAVDPRSEKAIATLLPEVRPYARALIHAAKAQGIVMKVTSAYRTYEEQDELYAQGRTKPGKIVTGARGGFSSHNFATAFDLTKFAGSQPVWESPDYRTVGALGKSIGLSWGGDWTKQDLPHFYLKPDWAKHMSESQMMSELRKRKASGTPVYT